MIIKIGLVFFTFLLLTHTFCCLVFELFNFGFFKTMHFAPETFKCEVKGLTLLKFDHLLPLRFYVKSNLCEFKWSNNVIFANFTDSEL